MKKEKREEVETQLNAWAKTINPSDAATITSVAIATYYGTGAFGNMAMKAFGFTGEWEPGVFLKKLAEQGLDAKEGFEDAVHDALDQLESTPGDEGPGDYAQKRYNEFVGWIHNEMDKIENAGEVQYVKYKHNYTQYSEGLLRQAELAEEQGRTDDADHFRQLYYKYTGEYAPEMPKAKKAVEEAADRQVRYEAKMAFIAWCIAVGCVINNITKEVSVSEIAKIASNLIPFT